MSSSQNNYTELEANDAKKVDEAVLAIGRDEVDTAEALLREVVQNCPKEYVYEFEAQGGAVSIKFWDTDEFMHYALWEKQHGGQHSIKWLGSAYPRAFYYLGFLKVRGKEYASAITLLDEGAALEPSNPKFKFEKAQALIGLKRLSEALALYDSVNSAGPHVTSHALAVACRGRAFVWTEMGDLNRAEAAYRQSLELEPGNEIALNELAYIGQLRQGRPAAAVDAIPTQCRAGNRCARCGEFFSEGQIIETDGEPMFICAQCCEKAARPWWQFWR